MISKNQLWNALKGSVDVEEVIELQNRRREINKMNIMDIKIMRDGKEIQISDYDRSEFDFTGLNTIDFIINHSGDE